MSELQMDFEKLKEKYKEIDKCFDSDEEALEYYKKQVRELDEEIKTISERADKYSGIVVCYDNYTECYRDYIIENYNNFKTYVFIQFFIVIAGLILMFYIPLFWARILLILFILLVIIYNLVIIFKVEKTKKSIKEELLNKYNIDINTLTEEDVEDMSLNVLCNKVKENNIFNEMREYSYFANMKSSSIYAKKNGKKAK